MSEKKHIDRLFQEKFKDFDVAPPENMWKNIEAELQKDKKKRRVIPIWWYRVGGIAALFVIGLMLSWPIINGNHDTVTDPVVNPVVQEEDAAKQNSNGGDQNGNGAIVPDTESAVTQGGTNQTGNAASATENETTNSGVNATSGNQGATVMGSVKQQDAVVMGTGSNKSGKTSSKTKSGNENITSPVTQDKLLTQEERIAQGKTNTKSNGNTASGNENRSGITTDTDKLDVLQKENNQGVANNNTPVNSDKIDIQNDNNTTDENSIQFDDAEKESKLNQLINGNESEVADAEATVDTAVVEEENELEKLLREKEEGEKDEAIAEAVKNYKWNVKPQVAPLFYNSMSQGSPIDAQFASNSKNYDADMSYGVGLDYAINDKISIRSGINTVNLSYSTNDITYYASLDGQTNNIVSAGSRSANIVIETQNGNGDIAGLTPTSGTAPILFASNTFANQNFEGQMVQKMGYIEVPLEMSYKLLNKKFGIELIGGFSTLFLNDNNISVVSDQGYSTEVGEAGNLNDVNFSTNLGVGFKYSFWKSFEANFEPTFKYQVNTFNGSSGNFRPYFIGLYSGVSFKF
ncbi:PorT family protein [Flavobacterium alkalisoli]|uniref:PorT family protein n=1 Tax=Flavobacterium alkalisoli TaxID=2602769 RepID=A0A5B9FPD2_9FLAO|nr:PorT family protein [Flavobacterium alkalisoli]QEE48675.1 PorT family protein [Flavobacterium alkalisoli]